MADTDHDPLDVPDFLRRAKGETPLRAEGGSSPTPVSVFQERWRQHEEAVRERRKAKSRGRVGKMLAVKSDRAAVAAGKRWDVRTGRWT